MSVLRFYTADVEGDDLLANTRVIAEVSDDDDEYDDLVAEFDGWSNGYEWAVVEDDDEDDDDDEVQASKRLAHEPSIGHRQPNQHEVRAATNFTTMQKTWQKQVKALVKSWGVIKAAQVDDLVLQITAAVASGNPTALASIMTTVQGADIIYEQMRKAAEQAIKAATAEAAAQGVTIPKINVQSIEPVLRANAEGVATLLSRGISDSAARQALLRYGVANLSADEVAQSVREHLEELSDRNLEDLLGGGLTQAQNTGRIYTMANGPVATYYASELLDQSTCDNCKTVDEREYPTLEAAQADYPTGGFAECLGGPRCRGTLVAVYESEQPASLETEDLSEM